MATGKQEPATPLAVDEEVATAGLPDPLYHGEEPSPSYFTYSPADIPPGKYTDPHLGEIVPGRTYEVRAHLAPIYASHSDWTGSTSRKYAAQEKADAADHDTEEQ
jgi:hypothetical protein